MAALGFRRAPLIPLAGLAIALVAAVTAFLISNAMVEADKAVSHSMRVRVGLADLGRHVAEQNAGFRGFLLVGIARQREDTERANAAIVRQYALLRSLMSDEPTQRADIDAIGPIIRERLDYIRTHIEDRARGGTGMANDGDRDRVRALVYGMDDRLQRMGLEEQRLLESRQAQLQRLVLWLSIALAGAVLLVVAAAYLTVSDARARFTALRNATREARAAAVEAASESAARIEAEAQLRQIQKMESIGQLTGGIAHDFNNMLAVIVGSLDLARRRISEPERASRHIADALEGAGRATTLVSRLLAFSRRQALTPAPIETNAFLVDLVDLLRRTLGETVLIETELDPAAWPTFADPVQLESAMLNLAVNARDAMLSNGTLTLCTVNRTLYVDDTAAVPDLDPGDYVEIAVVDTGCGMSEDVIARAFDPFFTTKTVGKGTGLGLSQVFGFVRQSGGHVTIESTVGDGTRIHLLLPRFSGDMLASRSRDVPDGQLSGNGARVLLVEDDPRVRRFSADALRELGYVPLTAANGAEALQLLLDERDIAVLFTDVVMPGMSGQELAAAVTAMRPGTKVLFTTGYARDDDNAHGLAQLDAPVLAKPFDITELGTKLREILA